jgi:hypothetical protein
MSFNTTIDNLVYESSTQPENVAEKPFIEKQWSIPLYDTNGGSDYNSNQVVFDTTTLMNCGQQISYSEALLAIPLVVRVQTDNVPNTANGQNWTSFAGLVNTDFMLAFKNSHTNLVHSIAINMKNQDIFQSVSLSNLSLKFRQHTELSNEDELLNAPLHGYCKDGSESWSFHLAGTSRGIL